MKDTVCFDIETKGLHPQAPFLVGAFKHPGREPECVDTLNQCVRALEAHLREGWNVCGHNILNFDLPYLCRHRPDFTPYVRRYRKQLVDTLVCFRFDPRRGAGLSMDAIWKRIGGEWPDVGSKVVVGDFETARKELVLARVMGDVCIQEKMLEYAEREKLFPPEGADVSLFYPYMVAMGARGVPFDPAPERLEAIRLAKRAAAAAAKLGLGRINKKRGLRGYPNLDSTAQVAKALRKNHGADIPLTDKGNPTLAARGRHSLERKVPVARKYYAYRDTASLASYLTGTGKKSLPEKVVDGCIYPSYFFLRQNTYRSSYANPPLNQLDKRIRSFVRKEGYWFVSIDIKALELATAGYIFNVLFDDRSLWDEVKNNDDSKAVTIECFRGLWGNTELDNMRNAAKTIFFAGLYGAGVYTILDLLRLPRTDSNIRKAKKCMAKRFSGMQALRDFTESTGEGESAPNIYGWPVEREGFKLPNYIVQSSGALYAYMYLGFLHLLLPEDFIPVVANHDEINYLASRETYYRRDLRKIVSDAISGCNEKFPKETGCDLISGATFGIGKDWGEAH